MPCFFCALIAFAISFNGTNATAENLLIEQSEKIDLSQTGHISSKGRIQDTEYNRIEVIDQLIAMQAQAIPYLIERLDDEVEIGRSVMDFWSKVTVADVALIILTDFFTDSSWKKSTIPGTGWDEILERSSADMTGEEVLKRFVAKHGRRAIKAKWERIWNEYKDKLYWDKDEKCFKVNQVINRSNSQVDFLISAVHQRADAIAARSF